MIVLGILLILVAAGLGILAWTAASSVPGRTDLDALGVSVGLTTVQLLALGALLALLLWFGWATLRRGVRVQARRRRERKAAREEAERKRAEEQREAEEQLAAQRRATEEARRRAEEAETRAAAAGQPVEDTGTTEEEQGHPH